MNEYGCGTHDRALYKLSLEWRFAEKTVGGCCDVGWVIELIRAWQLPASCDAGIGGWQASRTGCGLPKRASLAYRVRISGRYETEFNRLLDGDAPKTGRRGQ